jgi:hypothetical protein
MESAVEEMRFFQEWVSFSENLEDESCIHGGGGILEEPRAGWVNFPVVIVGAVVLSRHKKVTNRRSDGQTPSQL